MINRIRLDEVAEIATINPKTKRPRKDLSLATRKKYVVAVNRLKEFFGPERDITTIAPGELWDWSESLTAKYPNPITANSYRSDVRAIWNYLQKIKINVCSTEDAFIMEKTDKKIKAISSLNYWRVMTAAQGPTMAAVLAESGMRRDALRGMLVSATDFWTLRTGELCMSTRVQEKGGKYELKFGLHLSATLLRAWLDIRAKFLAALEVKDHDFVWVATDTGGPMSYDSIGNVFDRLKESAHVPKNDPANPHSFRHHFAQKRAMEGTPIPVLQKFLGHASPDTTGLYLNLPEDELRRAFFAKVQEPDYNSR